MPIHRGSVFLVALVLIAVMVVLAYGFIRTIGVAAGSARTLDFAGLARAAAAAGTVHACGAIDRDFLAAPGVPTTLRGRWRTGFLPIDSLLVGKDTATTNDDAPLGREFSPEDANQNDTTTENLLTELYCPVVATAGDNGAYNGRSAIFRDGRLMLPGGGRYIEPGRYDRDLLAKPVSFHLAHPAAADASSADPVLRRGGEPWTPDLDRPLLLDGDLRRTTDPARVRYRLRYAVGVEDLSGHLLLGCQGPYVPGAVPAGAAPVSDAEARKVLEVDQVRAQQYLDAFTDMALVTDGAYPFWAWSLFQGYGAKPLPSDSTVDSPQGYGLLRSFAGGLPRIAVDYDQTAPPPAGEPDRRYGATGKAGTVAWLAGRGVPYSFEAAQNPCATGDGGRNLAYVWTPFGHAGDPAAPAGDWRSDPSGVPWRVNLPTASPKAIATMLFAYLPQEAKTFEYTTRVIDDFSGFDAVTGEATWSRVGTQPLTPTVPAPYPTIDLFGAPSAFAPRFAHLAAQPYPGSTPATLGADWTPDLGKDIDLNVLPLLGADARACRSALWGQGGTDGTYLQRFPSTVVEKAEAWAGGQRWTLTMSGNTAMLIRASGYWYEDSYWLDLATAFAHACAVAQLAWHGETGASWRGGPTAGVPLYPAGWTDAEYAAYAGRPMLDLDVDGDGTADVPRLFRTVADVDRQFVKNLGEWPEDLPVAARPATAHPGLYLVKANLITSPARVAVATPSNNIRGLLLAGKITPGNAALMELALNDMRLSFFGASPQYPGFTPLDVDGDGRARCSVYPGGSAAADPATSRGPVPPPADRFSLTGCFVMQKSRYYRIFVRGEVFDELRRLPVARSDQETVYCVDPEGAIWDLNDQRVPGGAALSSRILYQRSQWNRYLGYESRTR